MTENLKVFILEHTNADEISSVQLIQNLWSGYGQMLSVSLRGSDLKSVVVKAINLTEVEKHPRGWNTDIGHERKLKSYKVEKHWYEHYSTNSRSRLPKSLGTQQTSDNIFILLEDLDAAGYPFRKQTLDWNTFSSCLKWLAEFHVSFLGIEPEGLWPIGTYWHLDTRPQELEQVEDEILRSSAKLMDTKLNACRFKTLVHGDAKIANFCFSEDGDVAGVDFQYVGGGCGMKDLAYFAGSCLTEKDCEGLETKILDTYFQYFHQAYGKTHYELEQEWRSLYRVAWADFHRFLKGWSPDHWKINSYSERVTNEVIKNLNR